MKDELFIVDLNKDYYTEPDLSIQKPFNYDDCIEAMLLLKMDKPKEPSLFNMPITINRYIPKNEMWFVDSEGTISKIVNIGNSKLYRFILWWQKIVTKVKAYCKKLADYQSEIIKFNEEFKQYMGGKK